MLERTLESVLRYRLPHDEIIVIDDGGWDWKVVEPVIDRVLYVPVEHRGYRLALMCNIGLQISSSKIFLKLDGDCIPSKDLMVEARQIDDREIVSFRVDWDEGGKIRPDWRFLNGVLNPACRGEPERYFWGGAIAGHRSTLLRLGGFREDLFSGSWGGEEVDLGLRSKYRGIRVRLEGKTGVIHQHHPRPKGGGEKKLDQAYREYTRGEFPEPLIPFERLKLYSDVESERLRKVLFGQLRASGCDWVVLTESLSFPWLRVDQHRARDYLSLTPPKGGILRGNGILFCHLLVPLP